MADYPDIEYTTINPGDITYEHISAERPDYYQEASEPDQGSAYTFDDYQKDTGTTAIYPGSGEQTIAAINYTIFGLIGEAGELANKWKKLYRDLPSSEDEYREFIKKLYSDISSELGDVLWYTSQLSTELGYELGEIATVNIRKLNDRKQRDSLRGSGDDR